MKYAARASGKVDDAHVGAEVALVDPQPARRGGHDDSAPVTQLPHACQERGTRVQAWWPAVFTGAKQANFCARRGRTAGHVQGLGARLGGYRDHQTRAPMELLCQVHDQPRLASTGWGGNDHRRVARPGGEKRGGQDRVRGMRRGRRWNRPGCERRNRIGQLPLFADE
jgi:hypothetical protein